MTSTSHCVTYALLALALGSFMTRMSPAQTLSAELKIDASSPKGQISPILNGVFFEDINFAADGGIYPERIKNGSFEFTDPYMGWKTVSRGGAMGSPTILQEGGLNANNPHYLRLDVTQPGEGFGLVNEGFRGMGVERDGTYTFSVTARSSAAMPPSLLIELEAPNNQTLGSATISGFTSEWKTYTCTIQSIASENKARLFVLAKGKGQIDLDMVSLFPTKTYKDRARGLRPDLVKYLADMKPGFIRFPGGCIVEGRYLDNRYQWKNTIGDLSQRKVIINRWNTEFMHRPAMDYFQSYGLGFFEYFQLCEDVGAKPLPILNCGMACQFNSNELAPLDALDPYIQDMLDLIEFANGPADSPWGSKRAAMGHPAPFNMTMMGVGNEQWGQQYIDRYAKFSAVLKEKAPQIKLISAAGPSPNGELFDFAWKNLKALNADIIDEHYYAPPEWFFTNTHRYDKQDRNGPKIFAGEFAAQSVGIAKPDNKNNWYCALSEAAFMTGIERNGDVVEMASYAPLFGHVDGWQWTPNLIWFDNLRSYGTPNYYVQKLFSNYRGTQILPTDFGSASGLFVCASRDEKSGDVICKIVNRNNKPMDVHVQVAGVQRLTGAEQQLLTSADLNAENSLDNPTKVSPVGSELQITSPDFVQAVQPYSLTIWRLHTR